MRQFQPKGSETSVENTPDVLSDSSSQSHELLVHLQTSVPSPLDLLLKPNQDDPGSILRHVNIQQALPEAVQQPKPDKTILGSEAKLSECQLWEIQERFYREQGIDAWKHNVPSFITSSAYIAEAYAEMVLAFVEDYFDQLDLSEPITIVEMATGTGRFSHLMLRELENKLSSFSKYKDVRFRYVMTDFTDNNPAFWEKHERLACFVEKGVLDFAVFNPVTSDSLTLRVSGETLAPGSLKNPLIAIGNYFFDSIKQDIFRVESKVLKEGLVTLERKLEGVEQDSLPHLSQIKPTFRYQELKNDNYYADSRLNAILKHYRHSIRNGSILFPLGAFDVLRNLEALSGNRLVLISSDKAYTSVEEMTRFYQHEYARHDGAFSYMVNYHAIGQYFLNEQGKYFYTEGASHSIQTVCCILLNEPERSFERINYLYRHKLNRANTINSVCGVMPGRSELKPAAQVHEMISHIRLNLCDPQVFLMLGQKLVDLLPQGLQTHHQDLVAMMEETWRNYFYYPGEANIPFWFAQIYYNLAMYEQSLEFLDHAIHYFGEHEVLHFLKGQNYEKLNQWQKAKAAYEQALEMKSDFEEALNCLTLVSNRLKERL